MTSAPTEHGNGSRSRSHATPTTPPLPSPRPARPEVGAGRARAERAADSPLGNYANSSSTAGDPAGRQDRRTIAWGLRRGLWQISSQARIRACGRVTRTTEGGPTLRLTGDGDQRSAGLAGLVTCGSVWACPVCARKIGARRAEEIRTVLSGVDAAGGAAGLITLTLRHKRYQRLAELWDGLRYAWSRVTSGRAYQRECEQFGVLGWSAVVEVTHGEHGWHPHLHVLVAFDVPTSDEMIAELAGRWFTRWERALARRGLDAVEDQGGLDARVVTMGQECAGLATYLGKIASEVTGGSGKRGRAGRRTPFQILADGLATGLADDIERYWEWEAASHGRRQLTWSSGLRERFGVQEVTDDEIAAEDVGTDDLIALPAETWEAVRDRAEQLLAIAETAGLAGACAWLDVQGLRWTWATRARPWRSPPGRTVAPGSRAVLSLG